MNPARSLGPALLAGGQLDLLWLYLIGTTLGAILAVFTFGYLNNATAAASKN